MQDDTRMIGRMMTRMIKNIMPPEKKSALETGIILPSQDDWPKLG